MSDSIARSSPDRLMSAFLANCRSVGPDISADAGRGIEAAHRTRLPVGWTAWTALVVLPVVMLCLLAL